MNALSKTSSIQFGLLILTTFLRDIVSGKLSLDRHKFQKGFRLLSNLRGHRQLMRVLHHAQTEGLVATYPKLAFKYLDDYALIGLSPAVRLSLIIAHYTFLQQTFKATFLDDLDRHPIRLWQTTIDGATFEVALGFPQKFHSEGDLCLTFTTDGEFVYRLIFIVVRGHSLGLADKNYLLISSIQGVRGFDRVKIATKTCHEVHPTDILMAVASGIGASVGIDTVLGIRTDAQIANKGNFFFSYDGFFAGYGELELQSQLYQIHLPLKEKPIDLIKSKYQKRTLRKRAFKKEITNRSCESLQTYLFAHDVGKPSVGASAPLVPVLDDSLAFDHRELDSLAA